MTAANPTLDLACELIRCPSVTPFDAGCQAILANRLKKMGFSITELPFAEVTNLWARFGTEAPLFVFAGHTDVVPTGPLEQWASPPFEPTTRDNKLFGRGTADMKSSIAAMIIAVEQFLQQESNFKGSIAFLLTSDEEGPAINGTEKVMQWLLQNKIALDYCLVGEPTSEKMLGDTIKNGRRGSLSIDLTVLGKQGHVAYPQLADNPIHKALSALHEITTHHWDDGNDHFPASTLQISNIHGGTGATNVIPGELRVQMNIRYNNEQTAEKILAVIHKILNAHALKYELTSQASAKPFISHSGKLIQVAKNVIQKCCDIQTKLSTSGGTSDARFLREICPEIIEFGPLNQTIHQINECIALDELTNLTQVYNEILRQLFK